MRPLEPEERDLVANAIDRYGRDVLTSLLQAPPSELWVSPDGTVSLVGRELAQALRERPSSIPRAGLPVGRLSTRSFEIGLEGAAEVAPRATAGLVRLRTKGAQLFLYGRDVLKEGIHDHDGRLKKGDVAILTNPQREALGLARVVQFGRPGVALKPVIDRGWYLREGG